jgi:hypothetical protein
MNFFPYNEYICVIGSVHWSLELKLINEIRSGESIHEVLNFGEHPDISLFEACAKVAPSGIISPTISVYSVEYFCTLKHIISKNSSLYVSRLSNIEILNRISRCKLW